MCLAKSARWLNFARQIAHWYAPLTSKGGSEQHASLPSREESERSGDGSGVFEVDNTTGIICGDNSLAIIVPSSGGHITVKDNVLIVFQHAGQGCAAESKEAESSITDRI